MLNQKPPTLRELLANRQEADANYINVSRHDHMNPACPRTLYEGPVDKVTEGVLELRISAWIRKDGIYVTEQEV